MVDVLVELVKYATASASVPVIMVGTVDIVRSSLLATSGAEA